MLDDVGELCSLAAGAPSEHAFARLLEVVEGRELDDGLWGYLEDQVRRWPSAVPRRAPSRWIRAIAQSAVPRAMLLCDWIEYEAGAIGVRGGLALAESPWVRNVIELALQGQRLGDAGACALARSPYLQDLEILDLRHNHIGDEGAIALANSSFLGRLQTLMLEGNHISSLGAAALAESPRTRQLSYLNLDATAETALALLR